MADIVEFELITPAKLLLAEPVEMVVIPGSEGDFGVLPGHAPLISAVRPGTVDVYQGGKVGERIFVAGGFAEVSPDGCVLLAEEAVPVSEIDRAQTEERLNAAREHLDGAEAGSEEAKNAERRMELAEAMLPAAEGAAKGPENQ